MALIAGYAYSIVDALDAAGRVRYVLGNFGAILRCATHWRASSYVAVEFPRGIGAHKVDLGNLASVSPAIKSLYTYPAQR